jgi:hypothetical protein
MNSGAEKGTEPGLVHEEEIKKQITLTQTHLQRRNSDCDQQVDDHLATFLPERLDILNV